MSFSFCCWCSKTKWGHWLDLRFHLFVFGVNQRSVCRWLSQWGLLFVLLNVCATPCDECEIWEHLPSLWENILSRIVLRLYGYVYKILRLNHVKVEFRIMVVSADFHSWITQFASRGRLLFDSLRFSTIFSLRRSGSIKFMVLFQDSDTSG